MSLTVSWQVEGFTLRELSVGVNDLDGASVARARARRRPGRGPALGQAWLRPHKLPVSSAGGDPTFLLALANGLAGRESERHAAIRRLIWKYLINEAALKRQSRADVTRTLTRTPPYPDP